MSFDPSKFDGFNWDSGNITKNVSKHDVTCREAEEIFFNQPLIIAPDPEHSQAEPRFRALGRTDARGHLNFQLPSGARSDWEVQVDGGPGHRDYLELPNGAVRSAPTSFLVLPQGSHSPTASRLLTPLLGLGLMGAMAGLWVVRPSQS